MIEYVYNTGDLVTFQGGNEVFVVGYHVPGMGIELYNRNKCFSLKNADDIALWKPQFIKEAAQDGKFYYWTSENVFIGLVHNRDFIRNPDCGALVEMELIELGICTSLRKMGHRL